MAATDSAGRPSLKRSLRTFGILLITLSSITPASSVFVVVPGIIQQAGTGTFLGFVAAAVVCLLTAFVYAELASAFPYAGGEYTIVGRILGPGCGFVTLGCALTTGLLAITVLSLGISNYITPFIPWATPLPTAVVAILITTLIGILHIRTNAILTGIFLGIELLALVVITVIGFNHVHRPFTDLLFLPQHLGGSGTLEAASLNMVGIATSTAIFALNGYGQSIYLGEDAHKPSKSIVRVILLSLVIDVITQMVPTTALLMGAPDLKALFGSANMLGDFIVSFAGTRVNDAVSLGIALAIMNANIAIVLMMARVVYSTGRDNVWQASANKSLMHIHARFHSPAIATLVCGLVALAACFIDQSLLLVITGTTLIATFSFLCIASIAGRWKGTTNHRVYSMPFFPLVPVGALAAMGYVAYVNFLDTEVGRPSLLATLCIMAVSAIYYLLVLRRRGTWILRGPND